MALGEQHESYAQGRDNGPLSRQPSPQQLATHPGLPVAVFPPSIRGIQVAVKMVGVTGDYDAPVIPPLGASWAGARAARRPRLASDALLIVLFLSK